MTETNQPTQGDVDELATLLLDTWKRVDPNSGVSKHPVSYVANFADMARAVLTRHAQNAREEAGAVREALEEAITHLTLIMGSKLCGENGDWGKPDETAQPYTTFGALRAARAFVAKHSNPDAATGCADDQMLSNFSPEKMREAADILVRAALNPEKSS